MRQGKHGSGKGSKGKHRRKSRSATATYKAACVVVAAGALVSCLAVAPPGRDPGPLGGAEPGPKHPSTTWFGAFLESDDRGVQRIGELEKWLGEPI